MAQSVVSPTPSQVSGKLANFHRVMENAGLPYEAFQMPIDDPSFRQRLLRFWISGGQEATQTYEYEASESQKKARAIMGKHYLGVEEVMTKFGVNFTAEELASSAEIPADIMAALEEVKKDYLLVAGYPLTILDVRTKMPVQTFISYENAWYNPQKFANAKKVKFGWHLVRKLILPSSISLEFAQQKKLVPKTDFIPPAELETYAKVLYFAVTGERVQVGIFARTDTLDSGGGRVSVGWNGDGRFYVGYYWGGFPRSYVGVASARK